nr:hypothetical protein CFP56_03469 [Quercus suber]
MEVSPKTLPSHAEKRHVVEDLDPVQPTVIDLLLDRFQQVVPIGDFGAERVGFVRVGFLFGFIVDEDLGDVESGVVVGLVIGLNFGLGFFEDAVGLHAPPTRVEVVAELIEVLLRGSEFIGSDSAT